MKKLLSISVFFSDTNKNIKEWVEQVAKKEDISISRTVVRLLRELKDLKEK
jgi:DNA polymerase III delta subunit